MRKFSLLVIILMLPVVLMTTGCSLWGDNDNDNPIAATTTTTTTTSTSTATSVTASVSGLNVTPNTAANGVKLTVTSTTPMASVRPLASVLPALKDQTIYATVTHSGGVATFSVTPKANNLTSLVFTTTNTGTLGKITKVDFSGYNLPASVKLQFANTKGTKVFGSANAALGTTGIGTAKQTASGKAPVVKPKSGKVEMKGKAKPKAKAGKTFKKPATTKTSNRNYTLASIHRATEYTGETNLIGYLTYTENGTVSSSTFKIFCSDDGLEIEYDAEIPYTTKGQYTIAIYPINYVPTGDDKKDNKVVIFKHIINPTEFEECLSDDETVTPALSLLKDDGSAEDEADLAEALLIDAYEAAHPGSEPDYDALLDTFSDAELAALEAKIEAQMENFDPETVCDDDLATLLAVLATAEGFATDDTILDDASSDVGDSGEIAPASAGDRDGTYTLVATEGDGTIYTSTVTVSASGSSSSIAGTGSTTQKNPDGTTKTITETVGTLSVWDEGVSFIVTGSDEKGPYTETFTGEEDANGDFFGTYTDPNRSDASGTWIATKNGEFSEDSSTGTETETHTSTGTTTSTSTSTSTGTTTDIPAGQVLIDASSFRGSNGTSVMIGTMTFQLNQTIKFENNDSTLTTHSVVSDDGLFSSGNLEYGNTYSYTFTKAGTYKIHCGIHSSITGTIIIQ